MNKARSSTTILSQENQQLREQLQTLQQRQTNVSYRVQMVMNLSRHWFIGLWPSKYIVQKADKMLELMSK